MKHRIITYKCPTGYFTRMGLLLGLLAVGGCSGGLEREPLAPRFENAITFDVVTGERGWQMLFGLPNESDPQSPILYFTQSDDLGATWSSPMPVPTDHAPPGRHNRGNDIQLALHGETVFALWTAHGEGPWGSGPLAMAISRDGGKTWLPETGPPARAPSEFDAGFRFPAIAADDNGLHAIWIHALGEERSLRYARFDLAGMRWSDSKIIDPHICACCWNQLEIDVDGTLFALYRDHNPSDMALATSSDGGQTWEKRGHAGAFDWQFEGCPHVGGSLVLQHGDSSLTLFASVWSGHPEHNGAYLIRSDNIGASWSVANQRSTGRNTDLATFGSGDVIAVWDQLENGTQTIFYATYTKSSDAWSDAVRVSPDGQRATHPRTVTADDLALILWSTELADGTPQVQKTLITGPGRQ